MMGRERAKSMSIQWIDMASCNINILIQWYGFGPPAVVPLFYEQCGAEVDVDVVTLLSIASETSVENRKPRFDR